VSANEARAGRTFAPAADVLSQEIEGEMVLLDIENDRCYTLDAVGTRIWQLIAEHADIDVVLSQMLTEFDVDEATLRADLDDLLDRLRAMGLVVTLPEP
jgi:hypothetical protein